MDTSYFNTYLYSTVGLHPSQMNNDLYKHLKNNLIKKMQGRCYKHYGYLSKIYKIEEISGGEIIPEDPSASAIYKVKFSCKICNPLIGSNIICEVLAISKDIIAVRNGPINIMIFGGSGYINTQNFIFDGRKNVLIAKTGNDKGLPIVVGTYVIMKIIAKRIEHNSKNIFVIASLENIASQKLIEESIKQKEDSDNNFMEYENIEIQNKKENNAEYVDDKDNENDEETGDGND